MYLSRDEEKESYKKNLFAFLGNRGVGNQKVPQIGGKELDLYELYQAVIRRGGAQKVSNCKLWKEIVNEFDLPPSCTSASFTLKNHYQKYLLAYEQKFFFGRSENEMVKELGSVRQKRTRFDDGTVVFDRPSAPVQEKISAPILSSSLHESNLKHNLQNHYGQKLKEREEIIYAKKSRLIPYASEVRRIMLAFESHIQDEVRFAQNSLQLYSCSYNAPFCIENYTMVFEGLIGYLDEIIRNLPIGFKRDKKGELMVYKNLDNNEKTSLTIFDNYNFEISDIVSTSTEHPLKIQKNEVKQNITLKYEEISTKELVEQVRTIFQILRNLIFIKSNDVMIYKNEKCFNLVMGFFFNCIDPEITKNVLEIVSILCKHIVISNLEKEMQTSFIERVLDFLNSDNYDEYESVLNCLHNLMLSQENEPYIENMLPKFLDSLVKQLICSSLEIIESCLEILCYLSDLKMSTRQVLARKAYFIPRLIALIAGNHNVLTEKIAKLSAVILSNISITPAAKVYFLPYERDMFFLACADDSVSELLNNILSEIDQVSHDTQENNLNFLNKIDDRMKNFHATIN